MDHMKNKRRKYEIDEINLLLEKNMELASNIEVEVHNCIDPTVLSWMQNYDDSTSGQPLTIYYCLMSCIAHLSMQSVVLQRNTKPRFLNLYSIILGYSGVSKSGSVKECRDAMEELYDFFIVNNIGDPNAVDSILDKFTEAGFLDQLKESTNVMIIQEEIDLALKQMGFFSNTIPETVRQMFCQLFDGFSIRKKTKGYRQKIRNARMTICGSSTGVLLPPILQEFLKNVMTDGVVVRCLFLVIGYHKYLGSNQTGPKTNMPTIAQLLMCTALLGPREYIYSAEAQSKLDIYLEELADQAHNATSSRLQSFLAKQAAQITRISALTQIIDLLPMIIERVNILHAKDDTLGLNLRLFHEIQQNIQLLFQSQIFITEASITRAIYFHGFLLEQTLKVFDISSLQTPERNFNQIIGTDIKKILSREILMLPKVIISREDLYLSNVSRKIDRNIANETFENLVSEGLLLKEYFILTSTRRPIISFAKILPTNDAESLDISKKLLLYNIHLSTYIEVSKTIGVTSVSNLTIMGKDLFSKHPYTAIFHIHQNTLTPITSNNTQSTSAQLTIQSSVVPKNTVTLTSRSTIQTTTNNPIHSSWSTTSMNLQTHIHSQKKTFVSKSHARKNFSNHDNDTADEIEVITTDELNLFD